MVHIVCARKKHLSQTMRTILILPHLLYLFYFLLENNNFQRLTYEYFSNAPKFLALRDLAFMMKKQDALKIIVRTRIKNNADNFAQRGKTRKKLATKWRAFLIVFFLMKLLIFNNFIHFLLTIKSKCKDI